MIKVTGGLIQSCGKFLVARRGPNESSPGLWEFPGGKLEDGETLEDCIKRELTEELGIYSKIGKLYFQYEYHYNKISFDLYFFKVNSYEGSIHLSVHDELKWITVSDIDKSMFLPGDGPLIDKLAKDKPMWF